MNPILLSPRSHMEALKVRGFHTSLYFINSRSSACGCTSWVGREMLLEYQETVQACHLRLTEMVLQGIGGCGCEEAAAAKGKCSCSAGVQAVANQQTLARV
jgi:hypothetical protein